MKRMLFNATYQEELRVASVEGQKLINFDIETTSKAQRRGNIYCGIITRVEASLEACFVDYGTDKQGFLPFKEIDPAYLPESSRYRDYSKLTEGLKLIIQVEKDERGNKGAALTTYISLPGRYLVLMANNSRSGGISRRIDGEERDELKAVLSQLTVPGGMSIIARTAALGRAPEELQWDLNYLLKLCDAIKTAAEQHDRFLIYQESNLVIRSIRDHFSPDITEILIDEERIYNEARNFMSSVMPAFVDRIKLYHDDVQLFSRFQIEHQIESAYSRTVNLPSGGAIVIDHTEALTAVDVNSARANKGADIEATALATNLEASEEIARQMRLRDLGGLVVVDFIDMENPRNQREVENFFKQQLGFDRARIQMGKLSKFGLLELSRQRLQASLEESTTIACPRCAGIGSIRGTESIAVHILRIIQEEAVKNSNFIAALHVQLPVEVATYLLNEKRDDVAKIENRMKVRIVLIPNINLESPHYKIRKITNDNYDIVGRKLSYSLVEPVDEAQNGYSVSDKKAVAALEKPAVGNIVPNQPAPIMSRNVLGGMFGKLGSVLKVVFGASAQKDKRIVVAKPYSDKNTTKSNSFVNRNQAKLPQANKTRPVPMNKSNTKVQTVRPTNSMNKTVNQPVKLVTAEANPASRRESFNPSRAELRETAAHNKARVVKDESQNTERYVNQDTRTSRPTQRDSSPRDLSPRDLSPRDSSPRDTSPRDTSKFANNTTSDSSESYSQRAARIQSQASNRDNSSRHSSYNHRVSNNQDNTATVETNIAPKEVAKYQTARDVISPVVAPVATPAPIVKPVEVTQQVSVPVSAPEVIVRKNTITDSVDLGNLQLVATTPESSKQAVNLSTKQAKRYNDVLKAGDNTHKQEVHYELVETKR
ncbi:MAG: Rne/Rng family ribonuclease [Proteobacteria bacterium]|nr:Rne/Rng family ribonuclease [Pseudomonadota bacterium]